MIKLTNKVGEVSKEIEFETLEQLIEYERNENGNGNLLIDKVKKLKKELRVIRGRIRSGFESGVAVKYSKDEQIILGIINKVCELKE